MITKKHSLMIAFAVCALALIALGSPQKAIERPAKVDGHFSLTVSVSTGTIFAGRDWGESTHFGRYENLVDPGGHVDLQTFAITATGYATAANGDQVSWEAPGSSFYVEWVGGTGRFENVTGGFNIVSFSQPVITPIDADTVIVSFTYVGEGRITY